MVSPFVIICMPQAPFPLRFAFCPRCHIFALPEYRSYSSHRYHVPCLFASGETEHAEDREPVLPARAPASRERRSLRNGRDRCVRTG